MTNEIPLNIDASIHQRLIDEQEGLEEKKAEPLLEFSPQKRDSDELEG